MLGNGKRDAGDVNFLKCVGAQHFARYLTGDADHGNRVEHGGRNPSDKIGRARSRCSHSDADATGGTRITVGHMGRALFMANQNVPDRKFAQRIVHRKNRATGIAEDVAHPFADECCPHGFCAGQGRRLGIDGSIGCVVMGVGYFFTLIHDHPLHQ